MILVLTADPCPAWAEGLPVCRLARLPGRSGVEFLCEWFGRSRFTRTDRVLIFYETLYRFDHISLITECGQGYF